MASLGLSGSDPAEVYRNAGRTLGRTGADCGWNSVDPALPVVLTAHASVQGAIYGGERSVMLGSDLVLPGSLVRDPRLDYVALGHIHKPQDLNEGGHHPVIYPGFDRAGRFWRSRPMISFTSSPMCERMAKTTVEWRKLDGPALHRPVCAPGNPRRTSRIRCPAALPLEEQLDRCDRAAGGGISLRI